MLAKSKPPYVLNNHGLLLKIEVPEAAAVVIRKSI